MAVGFGADERARRVPSTAGGTPALLARLPTKRFAYATLAKLLLAAFAV